MCVVSMVRATEIEPVIGCTMPYMRAIGVYARAARHMRQSRRKAVRVRADAEEGGAVSGSEMGHVTHRTGQGRS